MFPNDPLQVANLADHLARNPQIARAFRDVRLPSHCTPRTVDVRVEAHPEGGVRLAVRRFTSTGHDDELRRWGRDGEARHADLAEAFAWLGSHLCEPRTVRSAAVLTDLSVVAEPDDAPARLDADELLVSVLRDVVGQDDAVRSLCQAVALHSVRRQPPAPAVVVSAGPTGTGKTWTAQRIAAAAGLPTVVVDLAEHAEAHRVSSLLGSPPGYVGSGERSALLRALEETPRCLVVLDEWEKAHPAVRQSLLGFFDAGRLTAADGHAVHAPQAVVVVTTNLGADAVTASLDRADGWGDPATVDRVVRTALLDEGIPPELLGRVSTFAAYRPLPASVRGALAVAAVQRLAEDLGVELAWVEPGVVTRVLAGADARAGARSLSHSAARVTGPALLRAPRHGQVRIVLDGAAVTTRIEEGTS